MGDEPISSIFVLIIILSRLSLGSSTDRQVITLHDLVQLGEKLFDAAHVISGS